METSLLLVSPCDLSTQSQPGASLLLAHQPPDPSTQRWEGPGKGPEKTLLLFSWAGVCPPFYHCSKPALHTGVWLPLPAAQPALKDYVCMCAPAEGWEGWTFICAGSSLHPWVRDTALGARWPSWTGPEPRQALPARQSSGDRVRHG